MAKSKVSALISKEEMKSIILYLDSLYRVYLAIGYLEDGVKVLAQIEALRARITE